MIGNGQPPIADFGVFCANYLVLVEIGDQTVTLCEYSERYEGWMLPVIRYRIPPDVFDAFITLADKTPFL